jgi:hypothetical protein
MRWLWIAVLTVLASAGSFVACNGSPTTPSATRGNFTMMLTDSPFSDASAVLVTFSSVSVHREGDSGFSALPLDGGERTCDLKKLQGSQDILGVGSLAAGHYTQVRLMVSRAVIYFDNASTGSACAPAIAAPAGRSASVEIPSGEIKLNREFDIRAEGATTMVLDLDGDRSIHVTGNGRYMMTPVIAVVGVE